MTKKQKISNWKIIRTLFPYIWKDNLAIKIRIIIGLTFILSTIVLNLSVPLVLRQVVKTLNNFEFNLVVKNYQWTAWVLLAYGGLYTFSQITLKLRQILFYKVIEHAIRGFSLNIFNHLLNLDLRFHLQKKMGVITNSVEKFQNAVPDIFWPLALFIIPIITEVFVAVSILFYLYHWSYGLILLGTLVSFSMTSVLFVRWTSVAQLECDKNILNIHGHMVDSLLNYETVHYFNNQEYELKLFDKLLSKVELAAIRFRTRADVVQMIQAAIVGLGLCILTWRSGHEVLAGTLQVGDFIVINSYLLQFIAPLVNFGWLIMQMNQGFTKLRHVMALLEEKSEIIEAPNAIPLQGKSSEIILNNVHFHYQPDREILRGISFSVSPGKTLAVVGASGAGKSTIVRLLFRFYDVSKGSILINNQDIRTITLDSLHSTIGVVPQDTILFNGSLYDNLLYGNIHASRAEIEKVVKLTNIDKFITQLPEGYNTIVGERGLKLSGGEKQRIAIARALLKKPSIFIFDEATSSLDTETEREIKKNIIAASQGITTIIVAHRLSTITHADEIIVLDKGKIIEYGTHLTLLSLNATYAKLWNKQAKYIESDISYPCPTI